MAVVERWSAKMADGQEFQISLTYTGMEGFGYVIYNVVDNKPCIRSTQTGRGSDFSALARAQLELGENIARSVVVSMTKLPRGAL